MVRPPRLYASPTTGAYNERDALMRLLIGCIDAGIVPDRIGSEPLVTVDDAVDALLRRATDAAAPAASQLPWVDVEVGDLFAEIRSQGISLEALPVDTWRERILTLEGNAAIPVLSDFGLGPGETPATVDYTAVAPALGDEAAKAMRERVVAATRVFAANARPGGV
ncbi:MAG: hypothetical protein EB084_16385 [Proteobacteria bacterium]|nr:hypothetical protein [Pseudomonadota bacterium]